MDRAVVESLEGRLLLARYGEAVVVDPTEFARGSIQYAHDGSAVAVYGAGLSNADPVYFRKLGFDGALMGDRITLSASQYDTTWPNAAVAADGSLVVTWGENILYEKNRVAVQRFDLSGQALGSKTIANVGEGYSPAVAASPNGGFALAYVTGSSHPYGLAVRVYDAAGNPLGAAQNVGEYPANPDRGPSIAYTPDGNILVAWSSYSPYSAPSAYYRTLNGSGTPLDGTQSLGDGYKPSVSVAADGSWAIAWTGSSGGVQMRRFDSESNPLGQTIRVDEGLAAGSNPTIAHLPDGGMVVGLYSAGANYVRRYAADGQPIGRPVQLGQLDSLTVMPPSLAVDSDGEYLAMWRGTNGTGLDNYLAVTRFGPGTELRPLFEKSFTVAEGGDVTLSANADFVLGQTITAWEWDLNFDGSRFDVDVTGIEPTFSAASMDGPAVRTIALRVRADDGSVSGVATTVLQVTNVAPGAQFTPGGAVQPGNPGAVVFTDSTDPSAADRAAGFAYSYDFNNDGVYEVTGSRDASATVPAGFLPSAGSYTIRGRISDQQGGATNYTTQITVAAQPPRGLFSAGGSVQMGSGTTLSFRDVEDSPSDIAAGLTYSYDLNNDGVFDVVGGSASCEVPAALIGAPETYRFIGRITDASGAYSEYDATLRVTIPPDFFPTVAGLSWEYSGVEDGGPWLATRTSSYDTYVGENCFVLEERVPATNELTRMYYRIDGESIGQLYEIYAEPDFSGDMRVSPPMMSDVFSHPEGWTRSWQATKYTASYASNGEVEVPLSVNATLDSTETGALAPLQMANGIRFTNALVVELVETGKVRIVYADGTRDEETTARTRSWYVRGLGLVKEEYTEHTTWRKSTGETGVSDDADHYEIAYLPTWSRYSAMDWGGILRVNGTGIDDDLRFSIENGRLVAYLNGLPDGDAPFLQNVVGILIDGLGGNDRIDLTGLAVPATIVGGSGNDTITGGLGADVVYGGEGDDLLSGSAGSDTIYGNFGNDVIMGGLQRDSLMGGIGDDTITAGDGRDSVYGGDGRDEIRGGKGADYMEGKGKSDTIYGSAGNDTIYGNAGDDLVYADDGDDRVYVNDGAVLVFHDTVYAGTGADVVDWDRWDWVLDEDSGVGVLL